MSVSRVVLSCGDFVDIDIEQACSDGLEIGQACFFGYLSRCSMENVDVIWVDVSSGLQPSSQLSVEDQEDALLVGREHESAGCKVARLKMVTR